MEKFWCCRVEDKLGFANQFDNKTDAQIEATHLARLPGNQGKKVYVLEATDACWADENPVHWLHL